MNRANAPHPGDIGPQTNPAFGASVATIDRKPVPVIALPVQPAIYGAESTGPQQLDQLYPMSGIHGYLHEKLRPVAIDPSLLTPPRFQAELVSGRNVIRQLALSRRTDVRRIGRLARLLDEHDALCRLAHMYASALLQG